MGKLLNIATRDASRTPMQQSDTATVTIEAGIDGDYRGTIAHRQITVLCREAWEIACRELNAYVDWTARRANLLVEGVDLHQTAGQQLHIGEVVLEITGETTPCPRMDGAHQGLQDALGPDWRAGATCKVLTGGQISVGNTVQLEASVPAV